MKTKKKIVLGAVAAVVLGAGVFLYLNFADILVRTTEKIASNALGVGVHIGSIDVSLSDKKVIVNAIKVNNPPGYKSPYIITTDKVEIALNTASRELIDFKDINVTGSTVYAEVNEKGMNLVDLKKLATAKKQKEAAGSEAIRVIVKHMVIDSSVIKPRVSFLDREIGDIRMPPLTLSNIGQGGGVNAGTAITNVMVKYLSAAEKQVRKEGLLKGVEVPGLDDARKTLNKEADKLKGLFQ